MRGVPLVCGRAGTLQDGRIVTTHLRALETRVAMDGPAVVLSAYDPTYYVAYTLSLPTRIEGREGCEATTAVALVYAGVPVFGWTRDQTAGAADAWLAPASRAAIGAVGLWLLWRGGRRVWRLRAAGGARRGHDPHHHRQHHHGHPSDCGCGHAHGPTAEEIAAARSWREIALLVGGVALRPCAGALFLLALTWGMAIPLAGILGAYAMGLGVAAVTVTVALGAVWLRDGLSLSLGGGAAGRFLVPALELGVGALAVAFAAGMLLPAG